MVIERLRFSIPDSKKASPMERWQFKNCFPEYATEFPTLVDPEGRGWLYWHVHSMISFVRANPKITSVHAQKHCEALASGFDATWRNKVVQVPIFSSADNTWLLNLDGILADALEPGPPQDAEISFTDEDLSRIAAVTPPGTEREGDPAGRAELWGVQIRIVGGIPRTEMIIGKQLNNLRRDLKAIDGKLSI